KAGSRKQEADRRTNNMTRPMGFRDLKVYQLAYELAMEIFRESKSFPPEEKYSLTDQIRRSSRSVAANIVSCRLLPASCLLSVHISCRFASALSIVTSSTYSRS